MPKRRATTHTVISDIQRITSSHRDKNDNYTRFAFRGQPSVEYKLLPSIARNQSFIDNEDEMSSLAKYRKPEIFSDKGGIIALLANLQHYGIPTRLLDVTRNILVALFFACGDENNKEEAKKPGVVYVFKYDIRESCNIIKAEEYARNKWESSDNTNPMIIEAPTNLHRQNVQEGMYMLFLNDGKEKKILPIEGTGSPIVGKVVITPGGKKVIKQELEALGISQATLFPEDIDLFCKELKKQFCF